MLKKIKELAKEVHLTKVCFHGYISNIEEPLESRWALFMTAPPWLKDNVYGPWTPDLKGLYVLDWGDEFGCSEKEMCDPAELLVSAHEDYDSVFRKDPVLYDLFREAILKDNIGTFECPGTRS